MGKKNVTLSQISAEFSPKIANTQGNDWWPKDRKLQILVSMFAIIQTGQTDFELSSPNLLCRILITRCLRLEPKLTLSEECATKDFGLIRRPGMSVLRLQGYL